MNLRRTEATRLGCSSGRSPRPKDKDQEKSRPMGQHIEPETPESLPNKPLVRFSTHPPASHCSRWI
ncbi:MAG TPA: hypothetical protein IGS51_04590 [Thermoleptolyngbya sp. M55_K2018_002]|nr:hypothetical protein [Thermoleptolyngbya sp. M55_K2018_002]